MSKESNVIDMPKAAEVTETTETEEEKNNDLIVKFSKPYKFEGVEYTEVDLSGIENLNTKDLAAINRQVGRIPGSSALIPEASTEFALHIAARAAQKPIEFFELLPMKEGMAVRAAVTGFLLM